MITQIPYPPALIECPECRGTGLADPDWSDDDAPCEHCNGSGITEEDDNGE